MNNTALLEHTQQLLADPLLTGESIDEKIRNLLKEEYLRRLAQYRRVVVLLVQKYGMSFDEFVSQRVVQRENFSWHVETDAMDWETAVSGIITMERKLKAMSNVNNAQNK
ncbi:MAG: hypothetical protein U9Q82_03145 [Chloroflexota bacterium]|nr:hypothetical protein [Chloroflexota bacterium]